eukprot:TRINITY_DN20865_c0_g1_i1.p1 TRINITY_DN20865_c0_g1~~TRINITY_DN20865_c0_g1_i1.p1  ORF type:complete len:192 (+),score=28.29 TRINITY_DN20865_c0_g1_i1:46-621(+)
MSSWHPHQSPTRISRAAQEAFTLGLTYGSQTALSWSSQQALYDDARTWAAVTSFGPEGERGRWQDQSYSPGCSQLQQALSRERFLWESGALSDSGVEGLSGSRISSDMVGYPLSPPVARLQQALSRERSLWESGALTDPYWNTHPPLTLLSHQQTGRVEGLSLIHISEPTRLLSIQYAVFCLQKKNREKKI